MGITCWRVPEAFPDILNRPAKRCCMIWQPIGIESITLITVVFDGWQQGQPSEQREHRAGVQVIYSKRGERADQVIQRLAREYGADCAVVSSDHEIVNAARAHGAFVMGSREFAEKLRCCHRVQPVPYHTKNSMLGMTIAQARGPEKKGNPRKLPKSQRQRDRRLKRF